MNTAPDAESPLITIVGPTACGKTRRAVEMALRLDGEIISADSRQIYRGMDLGTGKDLEEYGDVPYHLIDIKPAGYRYNLHEYVRDFHIALEDIRERGKRPILCGGTGMYVETVLSGIRLPDVPVNRSLRASLEGKSLDELTAILEGMKRLHNQTDVDTPQRAVRAIEIADYYLNNPEKAREADRALCSPIKSVVIGLEISREKRRERISQRLRQRLDEGMLDEVRGLLDSGIEPDDLIYYGLEYKYMTLHLIGRLSYDEMVRQLEIAIHQFAKRQMTWFRNMPKRGVSIEWVPYDAPLDKLVALTSPAHG